MRLSLSPLSLSPLSLCEKSPVPMQKSPVFLVCFEKCRQRCVAACCSVLRHDAACCSMLTGVAMCFCEGHCCVLQCVAVCCSVLQCVAAWRNVLLSTSASVPAQAILLERAPYSEYGTHHVVIILRAVCCSVLQCVAVCCSMIW